MASIQKRNSRYRVRITRQGKSTLCAFYSRLTAMHNDFDFQRQLMTEIKEFHKSLAHLFGGQYGMKFMFLESEILIDVLLELNSKGIAALPIHDCILVKESAQKTAKEAMLRVL